MCSFIHYKIPKLRISYQENICLYCQTDKDQDGVLSKAEFCSMINKNKIRNPEVQRGDRTFDDLDKNKVNVCSTSCVGI